MDTFSYSPISRPDGDSNIDKTGDLATRLTRTEERLARAEAAQARTRRQMRVLCSLGLVACVGIFTIGGPSAAKAQVAVTPALPVLSELSTQVTRLVSAVNTLTFSLTSLTSRVDAVESKTQDISRITDPNTNQPTVRFTGVNVQVVNGLGTTSGDPNDPTGLNHSTGSVNGVGNLILGYDEKIGSTNDLRTGSHNLIVGGGHSYSSFGGTVIGASSTISAPLATVSGGVQNSATAWGGNASGGWANVAAGGVSSVSGMSNQANGWASAISGGSFNKALGPSSSISGSMGVTETNEGGWSAGGEFHTL